MFKTTDTFTLNVKRTSKKIKSTLSLLITISIALGVVYILYYGIIINDSEITSYTKDVFYPIAHFFYPSDDSFVIYQKTSFTLFSLIVPFYVIYLIVELIEKFLLDTNNKINDIKTQKIKKQELKNQLAQYDDIKYFSIGISFDYTKNGSNVSMKALNQLNKIVYDRIKSSLTPGRFTIQTAGIFTIQSGSFKGYDLCFSEILKAMSKIKKEIEEKYNIDITATITTDAYTQFPSINKITSTHYAIKGCNLKNKAVSTSMFRKKYTFLGNSRYEGTSIGLYNQMQDENSALDLYIIVKNLDDYLGGL